MTDTQDSPNAVFMADADQEAWVCARIEEAICMAMQLEAARRVAANDLAARLARRGVIQGTAIEIIRTLGGEPSFENLPRPPGIMAAGTVGPAPGFGEVGA